VPVSVLVVDDDRVATDIFGRILTLEGYRAVRAYSGDEGLRLATADPPDLLILDLRMPLMDGLAMLESWRAIPALQAIPVVIVTGDYFVDDTTIERLRTLDATLRYKPLWLEDLVELVRTHARAA